MWKPERKVHVRRASWKFISVKLFLFKTIGKVCAPADSRVVAPAAASPIRTQYPESRICRKWLRDSFDDLCSFKFRQRRGLCPSAKDALRISSLPKRSTSKILWRPLPVMSPYGLFWM